MTDQSDYESRMRWQAGCAVKEYTSLLGHVSGCNASVVGFLHDGKADMISRSRLSLASDLLLDDAGFMEKHAKSKEPLMLKVRGA